MIQMGPEGNVGSERPSVDQEVAHAFERQLSHVHELAQTTASERVAKLERLRQGVRDRRADLHDAMHADLRRAPEDIMAELVMVMGEAEYAIKNLRQWMKPQRVRNSMMTMGARTYVRYEPKGLVLVITPWNAPLAVPLVPLIGAIAAGDAVTLKPSELSPHTSGVVASLVRELFPPEEVAVFEGDATVASALLAQPFDHIFFTGGSEVGRIVARAAAEHLSSTTLELGGKNPVIVDETADIEKAARKIIWGSCSNSGQACVAPDYVLVHESVHDEFVDRLEAAISSMYDADGTGPQQSPHYARLINQHHLERVQRLMEDALAKGAQLRAGGDVDASDEYIAPTVLTEATDDMLIMQEEVFGPVLPVKRYTTPDDALTQVRRRDKPLALYVYSTDRDSVDYFLANTTAGTTVVNHNMIQAGINPRLPFGGVRTSGTGRIVGRATFEAMSNARSVVEQPSGWRDFSEISFPPYSSMYRRVLEFLAK